MNPIMSLEETSPFRWREKENPAPPMRWIAAASRKVPKIDSMLSSIGSTKQAESCPSEVPAFIIFGEFGRKARLVSIS